MTDELQYRLIANANLREAPSIEARVKTLLSAGTIFDVYSMDEDWFFGTITGYVHKSVVKAVENELPSQTDDGSEKQVKLA